MKHTLPEPFPYQHNDACWLAVRTRGVLLHEPGCGKTLIASLAVHNKSKAVSKKQHILVLGPKTLKYVWDEHINCIKEAVASYTYCNYDKLVKDAFARDLSASHYDIIILDECHMGIMRWSAKRCKNFFKYFVLKQPTQAIWCLTATPGNKSALDYHPLFCLCEPTQHGTQKEYGLKYCQQKYNPWNQKYEFTGFQNTEAIKDIFRRIAVRRTKQSVLPQLPKKLYQTVPVAIDAKTLADALELNEKEVLHYINAGKALPAHIATVIAAIGMAKAQACVDWVIDAGFSEATPIVIFAWTKAVVHEIQASLSASKVSACAITGETAQGVRQTYIQDFQAGKYAAIVLNMAAGGVGITLTKSSHVLFAEMPWSPTHYIQAQDRVHRIGQTNTCNIYNVVANKTVDIAILHTLKEKMRGLQTTMHENI